MVVGFFIESTTMKIKINKKELLKSRRHKWELNPATRVIDDDKVYNRSRMKKRTRDEIDEDLTENEA